MTQNKLLPCPFCGGKPFWPEPEVNMDWTGCTECQACVPTVEVWNTRAALSTLPEDKGLREALEERTSALIRASNRLEILRLYVSPERREIIESWVSEARAALSSTILSGGD